MNDRNRELKPFVPQPDDDMIVCRCEEITKGEIRRAVHDGMFTLTEIRRYLRTGMGLCQGRTCELLVQQILLYQTGERHCVTGTGCTSQRVGTGNRQSSHASDRNESAGKR